MNTLIISKLKNSYFYMLFILFAFSNNLIANNSNNFRGNSPLHWALFNIEKARGLISKSDVNAKNNKGDTPLHHAVYWLDEKYVELLLANGANPNVQNNCGESPIYMALWSKRRNDREILDRELEYIFYFMGSGAGRWDDHCQKAWNRRTRIVKLLLKYGVNPNIQDNDGRTLLHKCVGCASSDDVKELLKAGANPDIQNRHGETPLHKAICCYAAPIKHVKELLKSGANPDIQDRDGRTPLHNAVTNMSLPIINELLQAGANPGLSDKNGYNPFHIAVLTADRNTLYDLSLADRYKVCIEMFLRSSKLEINTQMKDRKTVLDLPQHKEIKKILMDAGAKSPKQDFDRRVTTISLIALAGLMAYLGISVILENSNITVS